MIDSLRQDVRFALRVLVSRPAFSLAAILTLALGIGANATLYALINAIVFKAPPQVAEPDRLVAIYTSDYSGPTFGVSAYPDYEDFNKLPVFRGATALMVAVAQIGERESPQRAGVDVVSSNYFDVLGVRPYRGSFFPGAGSADAVVISFALWQRLGERTALQQLRVNGRMLNVIGVAPAEFSGIVRGRAVDVWVTHETSEALSLGYSAEERASRGNRSYLVYARLADGVDLERAQTALNLLAQRLYGAYPDTWRDVSGSARRITVLPEKASRIPPQFRGAVLGFAAVLFATVGIVLVICCSNVAGLMLARATGRAHELAIRASIGATRGRIVRQLLTEATLLALAGGIVGVLAALWMSDWIAHVSLPAPIPLHIDVTPDGRVLLFCFALTAFAAILFGLAPALRVSRPDVAAVLKGEIGWLRRGARRRVSLRDSLVVAQLALSLLLLVGCLLFVRSVQAATALTPGFPTENLALIDTESEPGLSGTIDAGAAATIQDRIRQLPGVQGVSWTNDVPLSMEVSRRGTRIRGYEPAQGEDMEFAFSIVGPKYHSTIGMPLVRGREFEPTDRAGAPLVAIVNETFARRFFGDSDPLAGRLSVSGPEGPWLEVIGVARDGKYASLAEPPRPYVYYPALQQMSGMTLLVRAARDPATLAEAIDPIVREIASGWNVARARSFESQVGQSLLPQRVGSSVLGVFGALAMLLAAVGLYGSIALWVAQRTREFGVRMALGANAVEVLRVVIGRGGRLIAVGVVLGLASAWAVSRFLQSVLVGVGTSDPLAFAGAALLLTLIAIAALIVPALRAARLDPLAALRSS